jgi:hypothetical protein
MRHLFASKVRAEELKITPLEGRAEYTWQKVGKSFLCRIDPNFIRPGKDVQAVVEAGRAPDRVALMFCDQSAPVGAGRRIVTEAGPIQGVFEIRSIPDIAVGYATGHHIEVQIIETNQELDGFFPAQDGREDAVVPTVQDMDDGGVSPDDLYGSP